MGKVVIPLGQVLPIFKDEYSNTTAYKVMDVVSKNGKCYICKRECKGIDVTNTTYWQIYSASGLDEQTLSWLSAVKENYDSDKIETSIVNYFALTADDGVYTVRFPLWDTSNTCTGEKLDKNADKYLNLATDTVYEESNYGPAFDTYDCNANVDENGVKHITALKGMNNFKDEGKVDVFVLIRTYWEKSYVKDGYMYYSRSYTPKEGYTVVSQAINKDGSISPYFLISKYVASTIDGILYSTKGNAPTRNNSYQNCATNYHKKGKYYSAGLAGDYKHLMTTIWLKLGTRNSQSKIAGCTSHNFQYKVSIAESNVKRVVVTSQQANNVDLFTCVSVGDVGSNTNLDRGNGYIHNICNDVMVIGKESIDENNTALILDIVNNISTTATTYVSSMHEISGYSDKLLGRNGSIGSNTNGRHGAVIDGIEWAVGGYEAYGNTFMSIVDATGKREVYITNDASKITPTIATAKTTYKKSSLTIQPTTLNNWNYITEEQLDLENNIAVPTKAGQSGSGSAVGYADGIYVDGASSGEREFLALGYLGGGAFAGVSCVLASTVVGNAWWHILSRPSICGLGGELAEG